MDTILALREKRKNLWDAAKNFLDTVRDENGMVSAEDAARYDKMEADVVNLGKEIDRLERQQQLDAQLPSRQRYRLLNSLAQARMEQKRKAVRLMPIVRLSGTASAIRTSSMYRTP
jgi:HK97 family phage major capsid protein